ATGWEWRDVRDSTIARSYAEALLALGQRHDQAEAFATAIDDMAAILEAEPGLSRFLETPKVEPEEKKRVLKMALQGRVPPLFLNFLLVVFDKRRQRLIREIAREYRTLLDEH